MTSSQYSIQRRPTVERGATMIAATGSGTRRPCLGGCLRDAVFLCRFSYCGDFFAGFLLAARFCAGLRLPARFFAGFFLLGDFFAGFLLAARFFAGFLLAARFCAGLRLAARFCAGLLLAARFCAGLLLAARFCAGLLLAARLPRFFAIGSRPPGCKTKTDVDGLLHYHYLWSRGRTKSDPGQSKFSRCELQQGTCALIFICFDSRGEYRDDPPKSDLSH